MAPTKVSPLGSEDMALWVRFHYCFIQTWSYSADVSETGGQLPGVTE